MADYTGNMHFAFISALCDAYEWPDVRLVERLLWGFPVTGIIEDSGVFRRFNEDEITKPERVLMEKCSIILSRESNGAWIEGALLGKRRRTSIDAAELLHGDEQNTMDEVTRDRHLTAGMRWT